MSFEIRGLNELAQKLERAADRIPMMVAKAIFIEANIEATESKRRTPVEFNTLRDSTTVLGPFIESDGTIWCAITVGGAANEYAIFVHENPDAYHEVGQWKFLESTILESAPFFGKRVMDRVNWAGAFA